MRKQYCRSSRRENLRTPDGRCGIGEGQAPKCRLPQESFSGCRTSQGGRYVSDEDPRLAVAAIRSVGFFHPACHQLFRRASGRPAAFFSVAGHPSSIRVAPGVRAWQSGRVLSTRTLSLSAHPDADASRFHALQSANRVFQWIFALVERNVELRLGVGPQ